MREIKIEECEIDVKAEQEDLDVRGNAMASGDPAFDREVEDEILERLDRGDVWAWACVTVTVTWKDKRGNRYAGSDTLGGCTYRDREDFMQPGDYYEGMVDAALAELNRDLAERIADADALREELAS